MYFVYLCTIVFMYYLLWSCVSSFGKRPIGLNALIKYYKVVNNGEGSGINPVLTRRSLEIEEADGAGRTVTRVCACSHWSASEPIAQMVAYALRVVHVNIVPPPPPRATVRSPPRLPRSFYF